MAELAVAARAPDTAGTPGPVVHLHPQQEERRITSVVGMVVFLGSWAMIFGALFFAYGLYRARVPVWPPSGVEPLPLGLASVNTLVIALSSVVMHRWRRTLGTSRLTRFRAVVGGTLLLGIAFCGLQATLWTQLWTEGLTLQSDAYSAFFYVMTFFHAAHVLVGLGLLAWVLSRARASEPLDRLSTRTHLVELYWHFVGVVWVLMFTFVYVL